MALIAKKNGNYACIYELAKLYAKQPSCYYCNIVKSAAANCFNNPKVPPEKSKTLREKKRR